MASSPITSWQIEGEKVETVTDFIFLGSKMTMNGDCDNENKRHLLLGRKAMTNRDSTLKSRAITLLTKVCLVNAMIFQVVVYECESWTITKAECQRIDAFELSCWRRLLRVPWTARRSNQSILFFLFYFIFKLHTIVLVLPNIKTNPPQVYMCSPSRTLLPPPSPYHPSGPSQCTSPKHPISYIEPGLVTRCIHDSCMHE